MSDLSKLKKIVKEHERRISKLESSLKSSQRPQNRGKKKVSIPILLKQLKQSKFFNKPRFTSEIIHKLSEKGHHYPNRSLTYALQQAVRNRTLGRIKKDDKWTYVSR